MEVRADYSGGHDRIFEGARAIVAGTLVRFAIEAIARAAQVTTQGAVDRAERPLGSGQPLMFHRDSREGTGIEVVQPPG